MTSHPADHRTLFRYFFLCIGCEYTIRTLVIQKYINNIYLTPINPYIKIYNRSSSSSQSEAMQTPATARFICLRWCVVRRVITHSAFWRELCNLSLILCMDYTNCTYTSYRTVCRRSPGALRRQTLRANAFALFYARADSGAFAAYLIVQDNTGLYWVVYPERPNFYPLGVQRQAFRLLCEIYFS